MRMRLKPSIIPYRLAGMVVLHFNSQYAKIPDPTGAIWHLVTLLDGSRTASVLFDEVANEFPRCPACSIGEAIDDLVKYKMVELPEESIAHSLSDAARERFSRNIDFFGSMASFGDSKFAYQEALLSKRVCVLGCGGLGTHILFDLVALGIHHLSIVDFDRIETSNLNRQILYKETDVGEEKVITAKKRLLEFNSKLDIQAHSKKMESVSDVEALVAGHDIVICVADKPANYMSEWLNQACVKHGIPFVSGGLDLRRSVFYSVHPGVTGCAHCWWKSARAKSSLYDTLSPLNKEHDITLARPAPAFVTLVAVTAGMMVSEVVKFLTGCQPPALTNKLKEFRFDDLNVQIAEIWERNPECEVCGLAGSQGQ